MSCPVTVENSHLEALASAAVMQATASAVDSSLTAKSLLDAGASVSASTADNIVSTYTVNI